MPQPYKFMHVKQSVKTNNQINYRV